MWDSYRFVFGAVLVMGLLGGAVAVQPAGGAAGELNESSIVLETEKTATNDRVRVALTVTDWTEQRETRLRERGATIETRHKGVVQANIDARAREAYRQLPWVTRVYRMPVSHPTATRSEGVDAIGADAVHETGVTGENVTIGVIDTGFNATNDEIDQNIIERRSFATQPTGTRHGTAVAELVVDVAPDAELYLAEQTTKVEYLNAAEWLAKKDVDIIVTAVGFYQAPHDGTGPVAQTVADIVDNGTIWVNAAGNEAQTHWQGSYIDTDSDRWHEFAGVEPNRLDGVAGQTVRATLVWDDPWTGSANDYDLYLVEQTEQGDYRSIAVSDRAQTGRQRPFEQITATVEPDRSYALVVRNYDATGDEELEMFVDGPQTLAVTTRESSLITPAVAPGSLTVGAFDASTGTVEAFSSAGPTNDGREGIDVVGPDRVTTATYPGLFAGTSAAAPHVAGTAGLLLDAEPELSSSEVESILENTTSTTPTTGFDYQRGYGNVDAQQAVAAVTTPFTPAIAINVSDRIRTNTTANSTITVRNTGDRQGTASMTISVNGDPRLNETITLNGGQSATRTVTIAAPSSAGQQIRISAAYAGATDRAEIAVVDSPVDPYRTSETGTVEIEGFRTAINDFATGKIDIETFRAVIDAFAG